MHGERQMRACRMIELTQMLKHVVRPDDHDLRASIRKEMLTLYNMNKYNFAPEEEPEQPVAE